MNNQMDQSQADVQNVFVAEIVDIFDDVIEVKDQLGQTLSFKIVGFDAPGDFGELDNVKEAEKLEVGDKIRVNIEAGRITSIRKIIKGS